jgi:hypothetical protein
MRSTKLPHYLTAAVLAAAIGRDATAQGPPVPVDRPEIAPASTRCLMRSTTLRAATGGILGGWLGFVAAKIKFSDWNDASHAASGIRRRNEFTIAGAVLGAVGASLLHVNKSCSGAARATAAPRAGREPITADEIARAGISGNVYDVVYTLRRNWLNVRGINSATEGIHAVVVNDQPVVVDGEPQLVVYLDNLKLGTLTELKRLPTVGVTSIRYYDPAEANYLWGTGHTHGAIQVLTVER